MGSNARRLNQAPGQVAAAEAAARAVAPRPNVVGFDERSSGGTYLYIYTHVYIYIYLRICIYMYIYIYIYLGRCVCEFFCFGLGGEMFFCWLPSKRLDSVGFLWLRPWHPSKGIPRYTCPLGALSAVIWWALAWSFNGPRWQKESGRSILPGPLLPCARGGMSKRGEGRRLKRASRNQAQVALCGRWTRANRVLHAFSGNFQVHLC